MHGIGKSRIVYPLVFIIVASLDLGLESSRGQGPPDDNTLPTHPKVTVKFDSITINDDHDGLGVTPFTCCSGEWFLVVYVQGRPIDLWRAAGGVGGDLDSVDDGDTINFREGTAQVTIDMPNTNAPPLSIFTIGDENDDNPFDGGFCSSTGDINAANDEIAQIFNQPMVTWGSTIHNIQVKFSGPCGDSLGLINKNFAQPFWGEGSHTNVVSSNDDFILRYTITVERPLKEETGTGPQECQRTFNPIKGVTSSGNQFSFVPKNAIDNNLNTLWFSTFRINPFITLELTPRDFICGVEIAFADGNVRSYKFEVSGSNDGTNFMDIFSGKSTGTSTAFERYDFQPGVTARFVKVTITESNSGSIFSLAQISELRAAGKTTFTPDEECTPGLNC